MPQNAFTYINQSSRNPVQKSFSDTASKVDSSLLIPNIHSHVEMKNFQKDFCSFLQHVAALCSSLRAGHVLGARLSGEQHNRQTRL